MRRSSGGFALFEVVLGLGVLVLAGLALGRGLAAAVRAGAEGRRWSHAADLAKSVARELEAAYRAGAPACAVPAAGSRAGRGARVAWWGTDLGGAADFQVELRAGVRPGSVDTLRLRVTCR